MAESLSQEADELVSCQEEMKQLLQSSEALESRKRALNIDIDRRRTAIFTQRRLFTETWEMTFCESYSNNFSLRIKEEILIDHPRTISRVCSRWSSIVRNCPKLWSSISLEPDKLPSDVRDVPRLYLEKSTGYPLTARVSLYRMVSYNAWTQKSTLAREILAQHISRCRVLILGAGDLEFLGAPIPDLSFPHLQYIVLDTLSDSLPDTKQWFWDAILCAPRLTKARSFDLLPPSTLPYNQLTTMALTLPADVLDYNAVALFKTLSSCPKLERLSLQLMDDTVFHGRTGPFVVEITFLRCLVVDDLDSPRGKGNNSILPVPF
ncbi:hypothetical protein V5O48_014724 [Marasmius crinis-equi]|uniref:F-box domain-containing protein n=1 Tax=Marasmius crinis-equi TaxID=585013 RepID=A0ABR3EWJ3_9AGAR